MRWYEGFVAYEGVGVVSVLEAVLVSVAYEVIKGVSFTGWVSVVVVLIVKVIIAVRF